MTNWRRDSKAYAKDIIVIDEGDQYLVRDISDIAKADWPRSFVLLSALPKSNWTAS